MGLYDDVTMKANPALYAPPVAPREDPEVIKKHETGGEIVIPNHPLPKSEQALDTLISHLQGKVQREKDFFDRTIEDRLEEAVEKINVGEYNHLTGVLITPAGKSGKGIVVTHDGVHEIPEVILGRGVFVSLLFECENGGCTIRSYHFHKGNTSYTDEYLEKRGHSYVIWRD